jgi:metal-dependent amidase/aminoacylase/carboxypeptidase family protein
MAEPESKPNMDTQKPNEAPVEPEKNTEKEPVKTETNEQEDDWKARVEKIAQSAADKVRTEYTKRLKDAQKEIELLKTEKMSESEKREFEAQKLKDALDEKDRDLTRREMELLAVKSLDEKKLPSAFIEFVIGENEEKTIGRIAQLEKVFSEELKNAVNERMKTFGREPKRGGGADPNSFEGMTPTEVQEKARTDLEWFRKNETAIMEHFKGGYKK